MKIVIPLLNVICVQLSIGLELSLFLNSHTTEAVFTSHENAVVNELYSSVRSFMGIQSSYNITGNTKRDIWKFLEFLEQVLVYSSI